MTNRLPPARNGSPNPPVFAKSREKCANLPRDSVMGTKPLTQRNSSKDKNHNEIVKALRLAGYAVHETHMVGNGFPDLVVGIPDPDGGPGVNLLLEIKSKAKWSLSDKQLQFFAEWPGLIAVVASPAEALELCNGIRIDRLSVLNDKDS